MSPGFREGIESQPENLRAGAASVAAALDGLDIAPLRRGTVVFSGIGASWNALLPAVRALRRSGRRAFAVPIHELTAGARAGDAYVLVSQSGASTEVLAALEILDGAPVYAVSSRSEAPLAREVGNWLPLGPLADTDVSTLSYTATLQSLGLLCDAILELDHRESWTALPDLANATLARHGEAAAVFGERLAAIRTVDAVGSGAAVGSALETALLAREALRLPAHGEETRQYLHGELECVEQGFGCVVFGAGRELELAAALASYGASTCVIGPRPAPDAAVTSFVLPPVLEHAAPILEILPVQLVVLAAAAALGLPVQSLRRAQEDTKVAGPR
jgi:glucosamine--fructose-6-phosphate aminotransferase (isomerizing)